MLPGTFFAHLCAIIVRSSVRRAVKEVYLSALLSRSCCALCGQAGDLLIILSGQRAEAPQSSCAPVQAAAQKRLLIGIMPETMPISVWSKTG